MRCLSFLAIPLLAASLAAGAPEPSSPSPLRQPQAPDETWVSSPDVSPPWAKDELVRLEREIAQRLDQDGYPQVLTLQPDQHELLATFRADARVLIAEEVRAARAELLVAWEQVLHPDQWIGFRKLPALHDRSPGELKELLRLSKEQRKGMQQARGAAQQRLKGWRTVLRDQLRKQANELLDPPERTRLDTWKRLAAQEAQRGRRAAQLVGAEVAAVIQPHVDVILSAQREEAWERFELLQGLDPGGDEAKDAEQLARFRLARAARAERVAQAQAALRELSGPAELARLVGLGLLPD